MMKDILENLQSIADIYFKIYDFVAMTTILLVVKKKRVILNKFCNVLSQCLENADRTNDEKKLFLFRIV